MPFLLNFIHLSIILVIFYIWCFWIFNFSFLFIRALQGPCLKSFILNISRLHRFSVPLRSSLFFFFSYVCSAAKWSAQSIYFNLSTVLSVAAKEQWHGNLRCSRKCVHVEIDNGFFFLFWSYLLIPTSTFNPFSSCLGSGVQVMMVWMYITIFFCNQCFSQQ